MIFSQTDQMKSDRINELINSETEYWNIQNINIHLNYIGAKAEISETDISKTWTNQIRTTCITGD